MTKGPFAEDLAIPRRARFALADMFDRQRAVLEPGDFATALENEGQLLREERRELLFEEGLPPAIAASLESERERLASLYCAAAAGVVLSRAERRAAGTSITLD